MTRAISGVDSPLSIIPDNPLLEDTEGCGACTLRGFHPDLIAELHEFRCRLALVDDFDPAAFGDAGS